MPPSNIDIKSLVITKVNFLISLEIDYEILISFKLLMIPQTWNVWLNIDEANFQASIKDETRSQ